MSEIGDERTLERFVRKVVKGHENMMDVVRDMTDPLNPVARVVLTEKVATPELMISPKRMHQFYEVDGFGWYMGKYGTPNSVILADLVSLQMGGIIDETAKKGYEVVRFGPQYHPLYLPWIEITRRPVAIDQFAEFLLKNRRSLADGGKDLALTFSQIRASVKTEVYQGAGKRAINGVTTEIEISGNRDKQTIELPDSIRIMVPIFVGSDASIIEFDMVLSGTAEKGVWVTLANSDAKVKEINAFEGFVERLKGMNLQVAMGVPQYQEWDFIH